MWRLIWAYHISCPNHLSILRVLLLSLRTGNLWASWVLFFNTSDFAEVSWCLQCFPNIRLWDFVVQAKEKAQRNHDVLELQHFHTMPFIFQRCCLITSYRIILERQQISNLKHWIFLLRQLKYILKGWVNLWNFSSKHIVSAEHTYWHYRINEKYLKLALIQSKTSNSLKLKIRLKSLPKVSTMQWSRLN